MARGIIRYTAYPFTTKEQDPVVDFVRTVKQDTGFTDQQIKEAGGPTVGTLRNWDSKKVLQPRFSTVAAAVMAMGVNSIPLSAEGRKQFKAKLKK